jgi:ATP-dependent exoDNAse (exonuclease V) alpha subunit
VAPYSLSLRREREFESVFLQQRLGHPYRQAAEIRIIVNAHRLNQGLMPDLAPLEIGDFYFVDAADAEEALRKLLAIVRERIPKRFGFDRVREIQVLCPMNRGGLGAQDQGPAIGHQTKPCNSRNG